MKRREFVNQSLKSAALALLLPSFLASCKGEDIGKGKTVLIIGGGISGLATAKKLQDKGFSVTVLEAQDKVGGRLRSNRTLGIAFDEGASWIHGTQNNPVTCSFRRTQKQ